MNEPSQAQAMQTSATNQCLLLHVIGASWVTTAQAMILASNPNCLNQTLKPENQTAQMECLDGLPSSSINCHPLESQRLSCYLLPVSACT
jgi:hypothetical protein